MKRFLQISAAVLVLSVTLAANSGDSTEFIRRTIGGIRMASAV